MGSTVSRKLFLKKFKRDQKNVKRKNKNELIYDCLYSDVTQKAKNRLLQTNSESPINITSNGDNFKENLLRYPIEFLYQKNDCCEKMFNTGHTFQVDCNGRENKICGGPFINSFNLLQFHAHWGKVNHEHGGGSDHLVDSKSYAAEIHLVHWNCEKYKTLKNALNSNSYDGFAVLATLVKIGSTNREFQKLINCLNEIKYKGQEILFSHCTLDLKSLLPKNTQKYWTYQSSLNASPCTRCVQWVVFKEPIEISLQQV